MTNRQINRQLRHFDNLRREWIAILDENPGHSSATNNTRIPGRKVRA